MIDVRRAVVGLDVLTPREREHDGEHERDHEKQDGARRRLIWDLPEDAGRGLVRFQLVVSAAGSAKPVEVIEGLWGADVAADVALARVGLWAVEEEIDQDVMTDPPAALPANPIADGLIDPLDVDRLRLRSGPRLASLLGQPATESAAVLSL